MTPFFKCFPLDVFEKTFQLSTQCARVHAYCSPFPALNIKRRNEPVATDAVYCDTSAINDGSKCAQTFVGTETLVSDDYGMKSYKKNRQQFRRKHQKKR